ncbi:alpha-glucoside-specific PTS transporter subunit IIBC [Lactobacillus delbrueckii]|uniref:alpha-glucoside-specific PTS transporter subunit IIBC n=1 Tax=Lactobacillus delbrueckii TaxID=1584 RepID=UPI001E2D351D|nr:alpha-glucoside-specific PTS transporter subunit IIBC [Lactobacillus delbrueckii]MCD5537726.1 alpha-glucoside-specific PTS transporter subunit IIBC [Lactobacillus delbrueckii subsp. lactis]
MMQKLQKFGAAMFVPVLLFSFAGIVVALTSLFNNPLIFGSLANTNTFWYGLWDTVQQGGWTVFNQVDMLFVVGLPIGLAKKAHGRAAMEAIVTYWTFNYFIAGFLTHWGAFFGLKDYVNTQIVANSANNGLTMIAGIKTLDTSIVGSLVIAGIVVWLHNRYFDKKLPDFLGTFQGSAFVVILGFVAMFPVAFLTCLIWPRVQMGIIGLQEFMASSGLIGVWIFNFLNRVLIPTGLHHLVYIPFQYGPAVVAGGLQPWWLKHLTEFAESTKSLKSLAPNMGFMLYGNEKVFLVPAICLAFYHTAKKGKKKQTSALLLPAALTSFLAGITEPVDFTYLFAAPILWVVYSVLAATMNTTMYIFGVVGQMTDGAIGIASMNWLPLWANHWHTYMAQFIIGLIYAVIIYFIFRFMIVKFNYATPGREADDQEVKLMNKKQYKEAKAAEQAAEAAGQNSSDPYIARATAYTTLLGGPENIAEITSCATRLRVTVKDPDKVGADAAFRKNQAVGVVRHSSAIQIIVGLDVAQVLERIEDIIADSGNTVAKTEADPDEEKATGYLDLLGGRSNIKELTSCSTRVRVHVFDTKMVAGEADFKKFGASAVERRDDQEIDIVVGLEAERVVDKMKEIM